MDECNRTCKKMNRGTAKKRSIGTEPPFNVIPVFTLPPQAIALCSSTPETRYYDLLAISLHFEESVNHQHPQGPQRSAAQRQTAKVPTHHHHQH